LEEGVPRRGEGEIAVWARRRRTMGEGVTGKDRYIGPVLFFRCRNLLWSGWGKEIRRLDNLINLYLLACFENFKSFKGIQFFALFLDM
jgi:hypothetical protein